MVGCEVRILSMAHWFYFLKLLLPAPEQLPKKKNCINSIHWLSSAQPSVIPMVAKARENKIFSGPNALELFWFPPWRDVAPTDQWPVWPAQKSEPIKLNLNMEEDAPHSEYGQNMALFCRKGCSKLPQSLPNIDNHGVPRKCL